MLLAVSQDDRFLFVYVCIFTKTVGKKRDADIVSLGWLFYIYRVNQKTFVIIFMLQKIN